MRVAVLLLTLLLVPVLPGALAAQTSKREFIATGTDVPYGYDYSEGVSDCISDDCADFDGTDGDFAYLGTKLDSAKRAYEVVFEIEAQTEGKSTVFDVVLSQVDAVPSATTKGDGETTESFRNAVKARFTETDNAWTMQLLDVVNGAEHVLGTTTGGAPNDAGTFRFRADANTGTASIRTGSGSILIEDDFSSELDGPFHAQWFVGYSTGFFTAETFLYLPPEPSGSSEVLDVDPLPPEISEPTQTPDSVAAGQTATVKATVTDDWGVSSVRLLSWVNGTQQAAITMSRSGDLYTGILPGRGAGAVVRYEVEAKDVSDITNSSVTFEYTVGGGARKIVASGGGGGLFGGDLERNGLFLAIAVGGISLAIYFLIRARRPKLAITILLGGLAVGLLLAFGSYVADDVAAALEGTPPWAYALLAVPVVAWFVWRKPGRRTA